MLTGRFRGYSLPHVVNVFAVTIGAIVNSSESHFGHDRAKNDSDFVFPV